MHGFYNRYLEVDLSASSFTIHAISDEILKKYLGGKGLGTYLLLNENPVGTDPLGPDNRLIFTTGPFCNGPVWGGSRYGVYTKSPLTGLYCESYSGGKTPEAMDACGFDAIVIKGCAPKPTALTITPKGAKFHDAGDIWGLDAFEAEDRARDRLINDSAPKSAKAGAIVIGPAAESGVRFSVISNDYWRQAGRAGAGTVMGSKLLKGIVFIGDKQRELANPAGVKAYAKAFLAANKDSPGVKAYQARGTTMMVAIMNTANAFPAKYWSQGSCDHWEKLSGDKYHQDHEVKANACKKCFMACGRKATIKSGRHEGLVIEGPEYETIYAFGGLCMIEDMTEVAFLNDLCDRLGMDTISAGNLVALAMEAKAKGLLDDGPDYGDARAAEQLVKEMAAGTGLGATLALGIVHAAKFLGMSDEAVHVKGLEPAGYDPRVLKGMGLTYATSPRGACHLRTTFYKAELSGMIDQDQIEGKAEMLIDFEERLLIFDCLILCRFYRDMYTWEELKKSIGLVVDSNMDIEKIRAIASHVSNMTRQFNLREGMTKEADYLPEKFYTPLPTGHILKKDEFHRMLDDYYELKGWGELS